MEMVTGGLPTHLKAGLRHGRCAGGETESRQDIAIIRQRYITVIVEGQFALTVDAGGVEAKISVDLRGDGSGCIAWININGLRGREEPRVMLKLSGSPLVSPGRVEISISSEIDGTGNIVIGR